MLRGDRIYLSKARHPGKPDDAYQAVYDVIYQLSTMAEMPAGLPDLAQCEVKLRDMLTRAVREDGCWAIEDWLGGKLIVMAWFQVLSRQVLERANPSSTSLDDD